jgi:hypothetical protein
MELFPMRPTGAVSSGLSHTVERWQPWRSTHACNFASSNKAYQYSQCCEEQAGQHGFFNSHFGSTTFFRRLIPDPRNQHVRVLTKPLRLPNHLTFGFAVGLPPWRDHRPHNVAGLALVLGCPMS